MKKRILLFTAIAGMLYVSLTSGQFGAGHESGYDCTGAETNHSDGAGCSHGSCHSTAATPGITVALEIDSNGAPIHHYVGGKTYTVKITGTNTTTNSLPKFGFQVTCIKGTTAGTPTTDPTNAGTFASSGLPANVQNTAAALPNYACNMIEHSAPITATTGSGGSGTTYVESFQWTAPASGTGTVSFWGVLNAVNGDDIANSSDLWNTTSLDLKEWTTAMLSVANETTDINVTAFPNPVSNVLNLKMDNAEAGTYSIKVFGLDARCVAAENVSVSGNSQTATINTSNWAPGMYMVDVEKDGVRKVIPVVK